jgi:hypothetical protein
MQTELWQYDMNTWRCSRILCVECCNILSASVSPDYSFVLYTTVNIQTSEKDPDKNLGIN